MDLLRAPDRRRSGLRAAEEAHLARLDESRHRPHGVLDRPLGIAPMLIVEVDHVDAEALEARLARLRHVLRPAVDARRAVGLAHVAELRGEHRALAPSA